MGPGSHDREDSMNARLLGKPSKPPVEQPRERDVESVLVMPVNLLVGRVG